MILVSNKIKLYQEPEIDEQGKYIKKPLDDEQRKKKLNIDLKEGVLKTNCGVPIVFVMNKSDAVTQSAERKKFEENSEFILNHIRQIALEYGASIVYVSAKNNVNIAVLYDYICHTLFNFDLVHKYNLSDKEAYFIPAGYDNLELLKPYEQEYEKKITPVIRKTITEEDTQCEDTNLFFESLKELGVKGKDKGASKNKLTGTSSFVEYKKTNFDIGEMKNYETNIPSNKKPIYDKEKKYSDKRNLIKEQIRNNASFNKRDVKNKEGKEKDTEETRKKIKENMLAKIKSKKVSKPLSKGGTTTQKK